MKGYIKRLLSGAKKWEIVLWWAVRAVMIGAIIKTIVDAFMPAKGGEVIGNSDQIAQLTANLTLMFLWEMCQAFSEKRFFRYIPSYVQDVLAVFILLTSFGGAFLNLYYKLWWWDTVLHIVGGAFCVLGGYELVCAVQKRDRVYAHLTIVLAAAFCFSFFAGTGWELFEFTYDQLGGGDAQHWSYANAIATSYHPIFDPVNKIGLDPSARFPIIDTMADIVCNTLGAVGGYIILRFFPYHHRGNGNLNAKYKGNTKKHEYTVK
ncbi:MAG: hypothetical protein RSB11_00770 [Oscillospiraceae bacterium]